MSCRCFLGLSRSAINHLTSTRRDLIYFIYFTLQNKAVIPKEYVAKANANKGKEEPAASPRLVSYSKRDPSPSTVRCAQVSGAGVPPYKKEKKKKRRTAFSLRPSGPSRLPLLSTPTLPTHPSSRHEQIPHPFHQPSSFPHQTILRNEQTAFPTWDWLTKPGHPRGSFPPTLPALLPRAWGSCSGDRVILTESWQNQHPPRPIAL